jgi:predicted nucleic-acid-binding protein
MIAVDTNILARLLLADDAAQHRKAVRLLADGREYTAPVTVILELVWVLRSYGIASKEIAASLRALLSLAQFKPKHAAEIVTAIGFYEAGLDFGDALHLAMSDGNDGFITFDDRFSKRAARFGAQPPVQVL